MQKIEQNSQVFVMTGYPDCQLHYQGFNAIVIAAEGCGYIIRDEEGKEYYCLTNELLLLDSEQIHYN